MVKKRFVKYKGVRYALVDLAAKVNMDRQLLYNRMFVQGWPVKQAVETPIDKGKGHATKRIDVGVEAFNFVMRRFYTKQQRLQSYKQLRKDFEEIQRMKIAA